jgi:MYXO-CTERM domain-containing protein
MFRSTSLFCAAALAALATSASADPQKSAIPDGTRIGERRVMVVTPEHQFNSSPAAEISNIIYMNRCTGGCTVTGGTVNDARNHVAAYLDPGTYQVDEFQNNAKQLGAAADAEWAQLVQCVREIYSPFNVMVTDEKPVSANYSEAIVGGVAADVGMNPNVGGVAAFSCAPRDNAMSFTFANSGYYFFNDAQLRVWELCAIVGQETAHNFSLDHSYEFTDGSSACNDPMTYRTDCGGQKFFRNKVARCGEDQVRDCALGTTCGAAGGTSQNSHQKLLSIFGAGQSLAGAPTVTINAPMNGGTAIEGQVVAFQAGSKRGVEKAELYLNGWKWADVKGAAFTGSGQLNPSNYSVKFPAGVPNSVIDIQIKAYDDLGIMTASQTVTVTKGAACASAETCATGQKCEGGKCFWDAPTGKLGDACTYQQFCESDMCVMTEGGDGYCSQECVVGATAACPMGFECLAAGGGGVCLPTDSGGCCSASGGDAWWVHGGLSLFVLGLVVRRRRRRHDRL